MELLDRYLAAVRKYLPWKRQDDIVAELRANLESQLEDKEAELGRPLTAEEAQAWLKHLGPPMLVAARYGPQMYLIGPGLFPIYWLVLRLALTWTLIIYLIVSAIELMQGAPSASAAIGALMHIPGVLITTAAWVTVIFAAIEYGARRNPEMCPGIAGVPVDWNPGTLPPVEEIAAGPKRRRSFPQAAIELVAGYLALIWILLIPRHPWLLMGPGAFVLDALPYRLAPVFWTFYWWIVGLNIIQLAWRSLDLWSGAWRDPRTLQKMVVSGMGLIPLVVLLAVRDRAYMVLKSGAAGHAQEIATLRTVNNGILTAVIVIFVIAAAQLAWDGAKMGMEAWRKKAAVR
jgi:hypothetical protein